MQVIYKIINLVNDKFYVGSTTNKKVRFREHRKQLRGNRHHCKHLQASWNKYGEEKFLFAVVEEVAEGQSLAAAEDRWLVEHFGKEYCYNSGAAAVAPWRGVYGEDHPNFGKLMAEGQKEKISAALKEFYSDITNHPRFGKKHSEETKAKISQKKRDNPVRYWQGKERSEETKAKVGASQQGKPKAPGRTVSEAGKLKIRANIEAGRSHMHWTGRKHTEEAKAKMSKTVFVKPDGILFPSLTLTLKYYEINMPTLNRALKSGKPITRGRLAGYEFSYGGIGAVPTENDLALIHAKLS